MKREEVYHIPHPVEIRILNLQLGANHPVAIQSMANTDTCNITASIDQLKRIVEAGGQLVRFTTQGMKEVEALDRIVRTIAEKNVNVPIVADVHFNAKVAFEAAKICDKVRINPGNFTEKILTKAEYSESEYIAGLQENKKQLHTLIGICKENKTALRIGVNHGSLSKRIVSRYGDTPEGMVESALEFLRICHEEAFLNVLVSLKSSNTRLMVQAVRLLTKRMLDEDLYYPLHLGVTESGDGLEGRIKSLVGIAPLLLEGMGDTIRVSLTEAPENELPVADQIRKLFLKPATLPYHPFEDLPWSPFRFEKIKVNELFGLGGSNPPVVISPLDSYDEPEPDIQVFKANKQRSLLLQGLSEMLTPWETYDLKRPAFVETHISQSAEKIATHSESFVIMLESGSSTVTDIKKWIIDYRAASGQNPIILHKNYAEKDTEAFTLRAAGEFGFLLIDSLLSGIWIENPEMSNAFNNWLSFYILQASRNRTTSMEYIACPSCGRTLFDIQSVLHEVRKHTSHLKGLKIAVMGCIVNGPGEMADADYGYVGSGNGSVSIYKGSVAVRKHIRSENAVEALISVIKENDDWVDP